MYQFTDYRHSVTNRLLNNDLTLIKLFAFYSFHEDISFPSLESNLLSHPLQQKMLFDKDDKTCINAGGDLTVNGQPTSLVIHWDPNEKNSPRDDVATYYCQPEFFVNVTHGTDVNMLVLKGSGILSEMNVTGDWFGNYMQCLLLGKTALEGLVRSKFKCECETKCHIIISFSLSGDVQERDSRICSLKVYD